MLLGEKARTVAIRVRLWSRACEWAGAALQKELMGRETVYLVQAFVAGRGDNLKAEPPIPCKSADRARRLAESLADSKCGVVAFSSSGDAELGDYDDEPTIILKIGRLPADFE